ncbi:glycosyltransferase family 4 protein [Pseudoalteromonas tetraodonis]|uniref:glycosyltransferase family 4 protein n=1 Tax=Pseudoalteromonas tetraodonis TaxID=43659 RepID=UPI000849E180|nr:glycosyltransferase family 4 protein [Pseudoalteromonas tetraodonis]ODS13140.1 glycosyl transferase family 1 [Pseudoalteromonas tetraodonis]
MTKKLLYIVNVDWFFISHRLPIALAAIEKGYEVHLACGVTDRKNKLESLGIIVHPVSLSRSGTSILKEIKVIKEINAVVKKVSPDVTHLVTIKGAVYGGLVTRFKKIKTRVASISGLGFVFIDKSIKARVLRFIVTKLYRLALNSDNTTVIFQNENDKQIFIKNKIVQPEQSLIIRGSGVDLTTYNASPEPSGEKVIMFLARLLKDKGLIEFCEAAILLKNSGFIGRFVLVGDIDLHNPNSITQSELDHYIKSGAVEHWGFSNKVSETIAKSHIMVLPSYREGLPKSLIEAAACGRVVITTDVPGCRDAITPNVTGILIPLKSSEAIADAVLSLCKNNEKRIEMGRKGRELAEMCFDIEGVIDTHLNLYKEAL